MVHLQYLDLVPGGRQNKMPHRRRAYVSHSGQKLPALELRFALFLERPDGFFRIVRLKRANHMLRLKI